MADFPDFQQFQPGGLCCGVPTCADLIACVETTIGADEDGLGGREFTLENIPADFVAQDLTGTSYTWNCTNCTGWPTTATLYPYNVVDSPSPCFLAWTTGRESTSPILCADQAAGPGIDQRWRYLVRLNNFFAQTNGLSTCEIQVWALTTQVIIWRETGVLVKDVCNSVRLEIPLWNQVDQSDVATFSAAARAHYACVSPASPPSSVFIRLNPP